MRDPLPGSVRRRGDRARARRRDEPRATRERLREAVRAIDRARGEHPGGAVASRTLTDARWMLLDRFERDGKRYVVAREDELEAPTPAHLSPRERQVLGYVALGHANKFAAYELGIAPATVGVLLMRAARKLRARSRADLVAKFVAMSSAP